MTSASPGCDPRLDRLRWFDPASRNFRAISRDPDSPVQLPLVAKTWTIPDGEPVLDQQAEGACVGFGITNELRFNPAPIPGLDATFARERIYWAAQRIDPWNGGAYPGASPFYEGTAVLAGLKAAKALGYYGEYRWAFGENDLALTVGNIGPAVIGVNWYSGMFRPNARGYLRPTGTVQGGHCVLVCGFKPTAPPGSGYYTIYNSWGPDWGRNGTARISRADMRRLLAEDGEAAVITSRLTPTA